MKQLQNKIISLLFLCIYSVYIQKCIRTWRNTSRRVENRARVLALYTMTGCKCIVISIKKCFFQWCGKLEKRWKKVYWNFLEFRKKWCKLTLLNFNVAPVCAAFLTCSFQQQVIRATLIASLPTPPPQHQIFVFAWLCQQVGRQKLLCKVPATVNFARVYLQHTKPASVDIANPNLLAVIANEMFELVLLAPRRMCWNGFFSSSHFFWKLQQQLFQSPKYFS